MNNKNIIFNHTLEQYNKKYRNRRYRLLKYTKKQVEDFDKQYGHYTYNGKTHSLEFNNYLLENRKWWFTKEDECYHEIPRPVRFTWFRNLNAGVQVATCALLAGGVIAGSTVGIIEYKKYDAGLVVMGKGNTPEGVNFKIEEPKTTDTGDISYKIDITTTEAYKPTKEGGKPELTDVSVKKGNQELEKFTDFTFNSASGEVVIKKEAEEKYYGKTVITPTIKTIQHTNNQDTWMGVYWEYHKKFQNIQSNDNPKKFDVKDIRVLGLFKNKNKKFVEAKLTNKIPLQYNKSIATDTLQRNAYLYFQDPENPNDIYGKEIGGGKYSHKRIQDDVFAVLKGQGYKIDYIIGENYVKFDAYLNDVLDVSTTINENGYITNSYGFSSDKASQLIIEYKGNPSIEQNSNEYFIGKGANNSGSSYYPFNTNSNTGVIEPIYFEKNAEYVFTTRTYTDGKNMYELDRIIFNNQTSYGYETSSLSIVIDDAPPLTTDKYSTAANGIVLNDSEKVTVSGKYVQFKIKWIGDPKAVYTLCSGKVTPLI